MIRKAIVLLTAIAIAMWLSLAPAVFAHNYPITAAVAMTPGKPRASQPCRLTVTAYKSVGTPVPLKPQRVWLVAGMTGHAMRPIEVELLPTRRSGEYSGDITFTMPGLWHITLYVRDRNEAMWAKFDTKVLGAGQAADDVPYQQTLEMLDPARVNLVPPAWVLAGAIGLVLLAEGTAVAFKLRELRQQHLAIYSEHRR